MKKSTKDITVCAVFAAVLCVLSPFTIPIGIIPISLGLFAVLTVSIILGAKKGVLTCALFILIGALGLPVFSGFRGGVSVLAGATGGYIISYVFVSLIVGVFSDKFKDKSVFDGVLIFLSCIVATLVCYTFGTIQYMAISSADLKSALSLCVYPFIAIDLVKCAAAVVIGMTVRQRIKVFH